MNFDTIIRNGTVVDGSGAPGLPADVGIRGDTIAAVGRIPEGVPGREVDAAGRIVCPGFIDMHSHSDLMVFVEPELAPKVHQGITTEVLTQDGMSAAPVTDDTAPLWRQIQAGLNGDPPIEWTWRSLAEYLEALEAARPGVNLAVLVPFGNVRSKVLGFEGKGATPADLERMKAEIAEGMEAGAFGMSLGLIYQPQMYATTSELTELYRTVSRYDGFMMVHPRNEGDLLLEAVQELIDVCAAAGCPLHLSHLKVAGRRNWENGPALLAMLEEARSSGLDVTFDQYPYTAGSTYLHACLPPWATEGGVDRILERLRDPAVRAVIAEQFETMVGPDRPTSDPTLRAWENLVASAGWDGVRVTAVGSQRFKPYEGRTIAELAAEAGRTPADFLFDLLEQDACRCSMAVEISSEENVRRFLAHPLGTVGTDGLLIGKPHPRAYGTFPRILGKYVRDEQVLDLPEAIRRMTSAAAKRLGLPDRGLLRPGMKADVVVFDPDRVADQATFVEPRRYPTGIDHVWVNGVAAVEDGRLTRLRAGRVLTRP